MLEVFHSQLSGRKARMWCHQLPWCKCFHTEEMGSQMDG